MLIKVGKEVAVLEWEGARMDAAMLLIQQLQAQALWSGVRSWAINFKEALWS